MSPLVIAVVVVVVVYKAQAFSSQPKPDWILIGTFSDVSIHSQSKTDSLSLRLNFLVVERRRLLRDLGLSTLEVG